MLDPVRQHQRDPLTRLQAEADQPGGQLERLLAGLLPGDGLPWSAVVAVGVRGLAAPALDGGSQQAAQGPALVAPGRMPGVLPLLQDLCRHGLPPR